MPNEEIRDPKPQRTEEDLKFPEKETGESTIPQQPEENSNVNAELSTTHDLRYPFVKGLDLGEDDEETKPLLIKQTAAGNAANSFGYVEKDLHHKI